MVQVRPLAVVSPDDAAFVDKAEAALWAAEEAAAEEATAAVVVALPVALQAFAELEAVGVTRDRAPLVETHWTPSG
jgi:hypothetical protein